MLLEEKYDKLVSDFGFQIENSPENISGMIRDALTDFKADCKVMAIWCYGEHTKMLMADFMNELKSVKYIIDEHAENFTGDSGFRVIQSKDVGKYGIDGIIISSFKYRNEIKSRIEREYSSVKYLDIYDHFEKNDVFLGKEYYLFSHPYSRYAAINRLKLLIRTENKSERKEQLFYEIIKCFVEIKDFLLAVQYAEKLYGCINSARNRRLLEQLKDIYAIICQSAGQIGKDNILMLCLDGMRDKDLVSENMPKCDSFVKDCCYRYTNAYSVSTSTYESLVPAYSENADMRTKYYENNEVSESECRFIQKAKRQNRRIYFYTEFAKYVDAECIERKQVYQTVTEKLWDFILAASREKNALFYLHVLYESHYSYPNPYIDDGFIAEGTNIMFDFLKKNGGKIRTDYEEQHRHSLQYLDDVLSPVLDRLKCRMVIFADHGNVIFNCQTKLEDLQPLHFTYHDDLIHIPLIIKSPEMPVGIESGNISLMEINEILICLMEQRKFVKKHPVIVKTQRSAIYNPDFQYLYKKCGQEQGLQAYEAFVFEDGSKLAIYENGYVELVEDDVIVKNDRKKKMLRKRIERRITVCDCDKVNEAM